MSPNSGWSNLVPTRTVPAAASLAIVEPAGKVAPLATGGALAPDEPSVGLLAAGGQGEATGQEHGGELAERHEVVLPSA